MPEHLAGVYTRNQTWGNSLLRVPLRYLLGHKIQVLVCLSMAVECVNVITALTIYFGFSTLEAGSKGCQLIFIFSVSSFYNLRLILISVTDMPRCSDVRAVAPQAGPQRRAIWTVKGGRGAY